MFLDRVDAGQQLAKALRQYKDKDAVVYGLPRGGVVVAAKVARELNLPLDVLIARKIGHPGYEEYAIAAVAEKGEPVINQAEVSRLSTQWFDRAVEKQRAEAKRRREIFAAGRKTLSPAGKIAIIVDDGIATGLTLKAAINSLKAAKPKKIIVAVPVTPDDTAAEIENEVDDLVALRREKNFLGAVGNYYQRFEQTEDQDVIDILNGLDD